MHFQQVIDFWFAEIDSKQWWIKEVEFDRKVTERFAVLHQQAVACELFAWRENVPGRLAEIIVLDQFSRNMFRDQARAFANDGLALALAQEAVACGIDKELSPPQQAFLYMPFMHSESKLIHDRAVKLFSAPGLENNYEFELKHKIIIDRFGRYPHRNVILGRESTQEEIEFLKQPGSSF